MSVIDQKTPNADLPLPHPDNDAADDVIRLRAALQLIDQYLSSLAEGLDGLTDETGGLDLDLLPPNVRALAGLVGASGGAPYFTDAGVLALAVQTVFGRNWAAANDSAAGRVMLALGSAATANVTTSTKDTTAGRLLRVADFGMGALQLGTTNLLTDLNDLSIPSGLHGYGANVPGAPTAGEPGAVLVLRFGNSAMRQVAWPMNGAAVVNSEFTRQLRAGPVFDPWVTEHHSGNQFALGATQATALAALGLTGIAALFTRVAELESMVRFQDLGAVATAGAQTVIADVSSSRYFKASLEAANTTGVLTINFVNVPTPADRLVTWHVAIPRSGRKTLAWQINGAAFVPVWTGGAMPQLNATSGTREVLMFYREPGSSSVYVMLSDSGAV